MRPPWCGCRYFWLLTLTKAMQGFTAWQQSKNFLMLPDNKYRLHGTARKTSCFHNTVSLLSQHLISVFISKLTPWPQQPALHQNEISNVWLSLLRTVRCVLHGLRFADMSDFIKAHIWRVILCLLLAAATGENSGTTENKKLWNQIVPLKNRLDKVRSLVHSLWYEQNSLTLADCDEPVRCLMLVMFFRWCGAHDRTLLLNCSVSVHRKTHERPLERWSGPIRLLLFCYLNQVARGWDFLLLPIAVLSSRRLRFEEMKKLIIN